MPDATSSAGRKETQTMHAFAMFAAEDALRLANERAAELRREAAYARLVRTGPRPGLVGRIAAMVSSIRAAVTTVDADVPKLPSLTEYPHRS